MTQVKVYGVSNYVIDEFKANPFDLNVEMKLTIPHIYMKGEYDVNGRLLLLPLNGSGNFKGNFSKYENECLKEKKKKGIPQPVFTRSENLSKDIGEFGSVSRVGLVKC